MVSALLLTATMLGHAVPSHSGGGWLPAEIRITADVLLQNASGFGGVEVLGGASIAGFGLSAALAYERVTTPDAIRHGGYMLALFELAPTAWTTPELQRHLGIHLGAGGLIGGLQDADVRNGPVLSVGVTVALVQNLGHKTQLALSVDYRAQLKQAPDDVAVHVLVLGIGPRWQE